MDLDALAAELGEQLGLVGGQIAVMDGGELSVGVHGLANRETGVAVTPETVFQVGSTTKVHTAMLVMQLVEQGQIWLDQPVCEQLPGFELSDPDASRRVTPRHLMSMTSGIDNGPYADFGPGDDALAAYVRSLSSVPVSFAPGSGFGYSNASTNVSGRLVEHVTGTTWERALRERLLDPAKLVDSACSPSDVITRRHAVGHASGLEGAVLRDWSLPRALAPAGATLCQSAADLVQIGAVFVGAGGHADLLSRESVLQMEGREVDLPTTLLADWWGLGPYGKCWGQVQVLGHSGTNLSGSSHLAWLPGHDLAIATTVNCPQLGYRFAQRALAAVLGNRLGLQPPAAPVPVEGLEVDADRLVGTYEMSDMRLEVTSVGGELCLASYGRFCNVQPSPLRPLGATTFMPSHPGIDGARGWALNFVGPEDEPATHLLNGFFALKRVAVAA